MSKKIVAFSLCLLMVLSCTVSAFAADASGAAASLNPNSIKNTEIIAEGPSGDSMVNNAVTIEQQEADVLNDSNLSKAKKNLFEKKFEEHRLILAKDLAISSNNLNSMAVLTATNTASGTIAVPYFKQENRHFCGPAATKQTIHFIKGASSTQSVIATAIGTTAAGSDLTPMKNYLNSKQSRNAYIIVTSPTERVIQSIAEVSVSQSSPAIARLRFIEGGSWDYPTTGHYMNISGYKSYGAFIRVTDPFIGYVNSNSSGTYYVDSIELYQATADHFAHQMSY